MWVERILLYFRDHLDSGDGVVHRQGLGLWSRQTISTRKIPVFRVIIMLFTFNKISYLNHCEFYVIVFSVHSRFSHTPLFDYRKVLPEKPDLKLPLYVSDSIEFINQMESPRFIKTHLPYKLLPKKLRDRSTKAKVKLHLVYIYIYYV